MRKNIIVHILILAVCSTFVTMDLLERPGLPQVFYHSVLKHPNHKLEDPRFDKLEDPRFEYYSENSIVRYSFKNASAIYSIHHISRKLPGLTFTISINIIIAGMDNNCVELLVKQGQHVFLLLLIYYFM